MILSYMNLHEDISRVKELMGIDNKIISEQVSKKSSKGLIKVDILDLDFEGKTIRDKIPILHSNSRYSMTIGLDNISNEKTPIVIENVKFSQEKMVNDISFTKQPIFAGYGGFLRFDIVPYNSSNVKTFNNLTIYVNFIVANKNIKDSIEINFQYYTYPPKETLERCKSTFNESELKKAVDWYKKWLGNDLTKQKFAQNWNYDNYRVRTIFAEYNKILDQIKLEYVFSKRPNGAWVRKGDPLQVFGVTKGGYGVPITINCTMAFEYDVQSTLIHEIQHLLSHYHKLHPYSDNIFTFYYELFQNVSQKSKESDEKLINLLTKEGFDADISRDIVQDYKWRLENDKEHLQNANENMSSFFEVRSALKLRPGQNITKQMLIDNVNNYRVAFFIIQWLFSGMKLQEYLDFKNSIAIQTNKQNQKDNVA